MAGFSSLYGFSGMDLPAVKEVIERGLGVLFEPHDSSYRGGFYYRWKGEDAEIILQDNYDCLDDDLAEPEFPTAVVLLYLDGKQFAEKLAERLDSGVSAASLLRRVTYA